MTGQREPEETGPPGHFISDDLREQTARFLEDLRRRIRREKAEPGPKLGPPQK
jgi:hypothetical protein